MNKFLFVFSTTVLSTSLFGQISVYDCSDASAYPTSSLEDPSFVVDDNGCFIFSEDIDYNYPDGVNKDLRATKHHRIDPGFKMGSSPDGGRFTLEMLPGQVDVALTHPSSFDAIQKYEKLEFGIKVPEFIKEKIFAFKEDPDDPDGLNPFLSWGIRITATFTGEKVIDFPAITIPIEKNIDAFYFEEYDRVEETYTGPINPVPLYFYHNYSSGSTYGGHWDYIPSDYCFRVRFAPPETGNWHCNIKIQMPGYEFIYPEFNFNVIDSDNPGYVRVGDNKRYLKLGNETYMPFGPNFPYPESLIEVNPTSTTELKYSESYRKRRAPVQSYVDYENNIRNLADAGATHFRMILAPHSWDIEFEEIGNYMDRMYIASEIDNIVDLAKEKDIRIQFNMLIHYVLNNNTYAIKYWDWGSKEAYNDPTYIAANPLDNGFCYHHNQYFDLESPYEFLTNPEALKFYKEKIRYIISRWGYSTHIDMFELMSEANQIGDVEPHSVTEIIGDDTIAIEVLARVEGAYLDFDAPESERIQAQQDVNFWHNEIANYIKNVLGHKEHLISVSYAGNIGVHDNTFENDLIDICSINSYNTILRGFDAADPDRKIFGSNMSYFHELSNPTHPDAFETPNKIFYHENYGKPFIFSETGANKGQCDVGHEFKTNMWMAACSGLGLTNDWDAWLRPEQWNNYEKIKQFFEGYDLDGGNWQPGHLLKSDDSDWLGMESESQKVEIVYLWNEEKTEVIGVIRNRTGNYRTLPNYPSVITDDDSDDSDNDCSGEPFYTTNGGTDDSPEWNNNDFLYAHESFNYGGDNKLKIKGLKAGTYTIQYYELDYPSAYFFESSDNGPNVKVEFPFLTPSRSTIAFKMFKNSTKDSEDEGDEGDDSRTDHLIENQGYGRDGTEDFIDDNIYSIYPNPNNGEFYIISQHSGRYFVYMLDGSLLLKGNIESGRTKIQFQENSSGIYMIRIEINGITYNEKVVVT